MIGSSTSATSLVTSSVPSSSRSGHPHQSLLHSNQSKVCPSSQYSSASHVQPETIEGTTDMDHQHSTKKFVDGTQLYTCNNYVHEYIY